MQGLFGWDPSNGAQSIIIAHVGLWVPTLINLFGVKSMRTFQVVTTILKFLPLIFLTTIGVVFAFFMVNWLSWNPSGNRTFSAVSSALTVAIFAFSESQFWRTYSMKTFYDNLANVVLSSDAPATTWADPDNVFASIKVAVEHTAYNSADIVQEKAIIVLAN